MPLFPTRNTRRNAEETFLLCKITEWVLQNGNEMERRWWTTRLLEMRTGVRVSDKELAELFNLCAEDSDPKKVTQWYNRFRTNGSRLTSKLSELRDQFLNDAGD